MLTPRQNAVRWGNVLMSSLWKNTDPVKFQSTSKQFTMGYSGTDELSDIAQSELPLPYILPNLFNFKSFINTRILAILNTNPHGFIVFTYYGVKKAGFINKIEGSDYARLYNYELIEADITMLDLTADTEIITADDGTITADQTYTIEA